MCKKKIIHIKCIFRIFCFICIGLLLVEFFTYFLEPKWTYPLIPDNPLYSIREFYRTNEADVYFLGTSHVQFGISPMELYKDKQIISENIATPHQTFEISYFFAKQIFKDRRHPKLIVLDVSKIFNDAVLDEQWMRYVTDSVPLSFEKILLINDYVSMKKQSKQEFSCVGNKLLFSFYFPLYRYHDRWSELDTTNFISKDCRNYFLKGYFLDPFIVGNDETEDEILWFQEKKIRNMKKNVSLVYENGEKKEKRSYENKKYNYTVPERNKMLLLKIKELCDLNGCELLLIKVPNNINEAEYEASWNRIKSEKIEDLSNDLSIKFFDLKYDVDLGMDWHHDTSDCGKHLNYNGAKKITKFLGNYILNNYHIKQKYSADYKNKQKFYDVYTGIAAIEQSYELEKYIDQIIASEQDLLVLFSIKDDFCAQLNDKDIEALKKIGFQTDFVNLEYNDSFIAIWNNGKIEYESISNKSQQYTCGVGNEHISIVSAGFLSGNKSSIKINDKEYSMNRRGINIVVFDKKTGMVVDSAYCDTWDTYHEVIHDSQNYLFNYQERLLNIS